MSDRMKLPDESWFDYWYTSLELKRGKDCTAPVMVPNLH